MRRCFGALALLLLATLPARADDLVSAVLPASRAAQTGNPVTAFATLINTSGHVATGCAVATSTPGLALGYQATDASGQPVGAANTPIALAAGAAQSFIVSLTPSEPLAPSDVPLLFTCANTGPAASVIGVNTLLLTAESYQPADMVALVATPSGDGVVRIPSVSGTAAFSLASINLGAATPVTVSLDTGDLALPLAATLCQTDGAGNCLAPAAETVEFTSAGNDTQTFSVFVTATGPLPFQPGAARLFVRFRDGDNIVRGASSVAVTDPATLQPGATPAGIYTGLLRGTAGTGTGRVQDITLLVAGDGTMRSLTSGGLQLAGQLVLSNSLALTGDATGDQPAGASFSDGQGRDALTIVGAGGPRSWLSGTWATGIDRGVFNVSYSQGDYERPVTANDLAASWTLRDPISGAVRGSLTISAGGVIAGTDTAGCSYAGSASLDASGVNLFRLSLTVAGCAASGSYSGLAALTDAIATNDTLLAAASGTAGYLTLGLTRF